MLNKLKIFAKITTERIDIPPPITAEKKHEKKWRHMLETKWPEILDGIISSEYLADVVIKFMFKLGTTFLILYRLRREIIVMDTKKETIILLMWIIGVKSIKLSNKTIEPTM